jgi:hypothetical protein
MFNHHKNELMLVYKPLQELREAKRRARQSSYTQYNRYGDEISLGFIHTIELVHQCEKSLDADDIASETQIIELIEAVSERIAFEESVVFLMYRNLVPSTEQGLL